MKSKYIPDLVMSVIYKNHTGSAGNVNFIRNDNVDYATSYEDMHLITLAELRETLEDIFDSENTN